MDAGQKDRSYWLVTMERIADPVLKAMAVRLLKAEMPLESNGQDRERFTHLEALARLLVGIAPWLESSPLEEQEKDLKLQYAQLARQCIDAATDPKSVDYCNFSSSFQPIVDAAFLAHAILRAPTELWSNLEPHVKQQVIQALKLTRTRKPIASNWLLFSAMIETFFFFAGEADWDPMRIDYALKQFEQWYLGDGFYGDGPDFHADYYNSFVIHPMLIEIIETVGDQYSDWSRLRPAILERAQRYATFLERQISPEGTYPVIGRSITYRFGVFHALAHIALRQELHETITPAQVRGALTAVMRRTIEASGTFDDKGWLRIGVCGHQPELGESYISTGSLYLCSTIFLPLGLPSTNPFWRGNAAWTNQKAWSGLQIPIDHSLLE